ncbi:MAG: DNA N-6-adenine-methyltransferase [Candidatus Binatia bacterium]|nr:DNA N-6-adenine-methyltransferase [Candidatus Binatia bacterium]
MNLVRYEAARVALQAANSVDEVKDIRDKAQAMAAYARQANDTQLVEWATEIKVRAERRAGELTAEIEPLQGRRTSPHNGEKSKAEVLSELGITTQTASRWERLAAIPEEKFEHAVAAAKEVAHEVTTAAMLRLSRPHVSHNSGENEWYTPPDIIERARRSMGAIDCDPASSSFANKNVKADVFYTAESDGLTKKWRGRVWMNPPYSSPLCSQFCEALTHKFIDKEIEQACVLVNNATETAWFQSMLRAAVSVCFLDGRVKYLDKSGEPANTPLQGQAVLYFGPRIKSFLASFSNAGIVLVHG